MKKWRDIWLKIFKTIMIQYKSSHLEVRMKFCQIVCLSISCFGLINACAPVQKANLQETRTAKPIYGDSIPFYDSLLRSALKHGEVYVGTTSSKLGESWFIQDAELTEIRLDGQSLGTGCTAQMRFIRKAYDSRGGIQGDRKSVV